MIFIMLCLVVSSIIACVTAWWLTRRQLRTALSKEGPKHVADRVRAQDRRFVAVVTALFALVAFLETLVTRFSQWLQAVQEDTLSEALPNWASPIVANGSLSWMLYLAIVLGVTVGLLGGRLLALREDRMTAGIGVRDLI